MIIADDIRVGYHIRGLKGVGAEFTSVVGARVAAQGRGSVLMALDGVSFQINEGECVGLIGANGAGKSTLLKVLAEILPVSSGTLHVKGPISAMLSRSLGLDTEATGIENVRLMAAARGIDRNLYDDLVEDVTEFCQLGTFMSLPVKAYSSGMRARLAFGLITALPSETLIVDEIIGTGDEAFRVRASNRFRSVIERSGTVVVATHNKTLLRELAPRTLWLDHGKLRAFGDTDETIKAYVAEMRKRRGDSVAKGGKLHGVRPEVRQMVQKSGHTESDNSGDALYTDPLRLADVLMDRVRSHLGDMEATPASQAALYMSERAFRPRPNIPRIDLPMPVDWTATRENDPEWAIELHGLLPLVPIYQALEDEPSRQYVEAGLELFLEWADTHLGTGSDTEESDSPPDAAWHPMAVSNRALGLGLLVSKANSILPDGDDNLSDPRIEALIRGHARVLADAEILQSSETGLRQIQGLSVLLRAAQDIGASLDVSSFRPGALLMMWLDRSFDRNGLFKGHAPDAHFFAHNLAKRLVASGWYNDVDGLEERMAQLSFSRQWLRDALGFTHKIGDTNSVEAPPGSTWSKFDVKPATVNGRKILSRSFAEAGYAFARTSPETDSAAAGGVSLFSGYPDADRVHEDLLSVTYIDAGQRVLIDAGKHGYGSGPARRRVISPSGHSTIEIEGALTSWSALGARMDSANDQCRGIGPGSVSRSEITLSGCVERPLAMTGGPDGEASERAVRHTRQAVWRPGRKLWITDRLASLTEIPHGYRSWLVFDPSLTASEREGTVELFRKGSLFATVRVEGAEFSRLEYGNEEDGIGWHSPKVGVLEPCWTAAFESQGHEAAVSTLIEIAPEHRPGVMRRALLWWEERRI